MSDPQPPPKEVVAVVGTRTDWVERIMRTLFQLLTAGVLTAAFTQFVADVPGNYKIYATLATTAVVNFIQNYGEEKNWFPKMLKPGP